MAEAVIGEEASDQSKRGLRDRGRVFGFISGGLGCLRVFGQGRA